MSKRVFKYKRPVYFSNHMIDFVIDLTLCEYTLEEIAEQLAHHWPGVTLAHVKRWQTEYPRFALALGGAKAYVNAKVVGKIRKLIDEDSERAILWYAERQIPGFQPKQKIQHSGRVDSLQQLINQRMTDEELREQGILFDDEDNEPHEGET